MRRHVYKPPKARVSRVFAILAGLLATIGVFVAVPLSQRLSEVFQDSPAFIPEEISVDPPEFEDFDVEEPPPEEEPEDAPEEMVDEPMDLDLGLEVADLPAGTGGGFVLDFKGFNMADNADEMFGDDLDSPPQPTAKFPPAYPDAALRAKKTGKVLVACEVDEQGKVASAGIRKSSGHPELDQAALAAVNRWRFKPGTKGGKATRASCVVPFTFDIKN
jgi:protein TonB